MIALPRLFWSGFTAVNVLIFLPCTVLFGKKLLGTVYTQGMIIMLHHLESKVSTLINYLKFFCVGDLSIFPHLLIYSINHLH